MIFQRLGTILDLLQVVQISGNELVEEGVHESSHAAHQRTLLADDVPEQTGHRVPVVHQHHPVLGDQVAVGGAPLILFLPRQHQGAGQAVPPHIRLAHLGVLGGGSVEQYRLQTGQGRVVIQFLRCQQHHRRSFRLGRVVGVGQGLLDGVPVHSGSLRFPVCFPYCTTLGGKRNHWKIAAD